MPQPEDYRMLVEREWADIHHSRIQEWTALGVVTGAHLGLVQLTNMAIEAKSQISIVNVILFLSIIGALFSILGALMTCRHRRLMKIKLRWIFDAEKQLGLVKTKANLEKGIIPELDEKEKNEKPLHWKGLSLPRMLSTSGLILFFYMVLLIIDLFMFSMILDL